MSALLSDHVQLALGSIAQGLIICDARNTILYVNGHFAEITGFETEELLGKTCTLIQGPLTSADAVACISTHTRQLKPYSGEILNYRKGGEPFWNELSITPVCDPETGEPYFVGVARDVTARRAQEDALRALEAQHQLLFDHAQAGLVLHGPSGEVVFANKMARALLGVDREEVLGAELADPRWDFIRPDGSPMPMAEYPVNQALASGGDVRNFLLGAYRHSDRTLAWLMGNADVARGEDGSITKIVTSFTDVTKLKEKQLALVQARNAAQASARRADLAEEIAGLGHWRFDRETGEVTWSRQLYAIYGLDPSGAPDVAQITSRTHPDDRAAAQERVTKLIAGDVVTGRVMARYLRSDGQWRSIVTQWGVERAEDGLVTAAIGTVLDLTDQVQAQAALEDSERKYRMLAENATDIIVRFGPDGLIRYVSPACSLLGLNAEEEIGKPITRVLTQEAHDASKGLIAALFGGGDIDPTVSRLYQCRGPNGRTVWLEGKPTLIRDQEGAVVEVVSALRDVTARRDMELALARSELRYRTLAENAPDMLTETNLDGVLTYVSPASLSITGYTPDELTGQTFFELMHPDDALAMRHMCHTVFASMGRISPWPIEFRATHRSGRLLWLESKPTFATDPVTGKFTGLIDVIRDITSRKELEEQLRQARADAESAARVKSEFLANMSHELRTPLTSILGFTRLAGQQECGNALLTKYIKRIDAASKALLSTVNDILDFSKLEAGHLSITPQAIRLDDLMRGAVDLLMPQAAAKDIDLQYDGPDPQLFISCDPDRMRQILLNLLGNAVKFTSQGTVRLSSAYDGGAEVLRVRVEDTGPGIDEGGLGALFHRFSQIDGSSTRVGGGTGLGLAICKGLVEAMGGHIGVSSVVGVGSCFWFDVPAPRTTQAPAVAATALEAATVDGLRILIVDDHPTNRELARLILNGLGAETFEACDGAEGILMAARQPVDVILMDLFMPKVDGHEALQTIRRGAGCNQHTPAIAFTANASDDSCATLNAAGFSGVVAKPLSPEKLAAAIMSAIGAHVAAAAPCEGVLSGFHGT